MFIAFLRDNTVDNLGRVQRQRLVRILETLDFVPQGVDVIKVDVRRRGVHTRRQARARFMLGLGGLLALLG